MQIADLRSAAATYALVPTATSGAAVNSSSWDTFGFKYSLVIITSQTLTGATTPKLQDSANDSTFADVTGKTVPFAGTDDDATKLMLLDNDSLRRYARIQFPAGAVGNVQVHVVQLVKDSTTGNETGITT